MKRSVGPALLLAACGGAPPVPSSPPPAEPEKGEGEARHESVEADGGGVALDVAERSRPASGATYEQAMAKPESVDVNDDRTQLTDAQLREPVSGVLRGCQVPPKAKVVIKIAVEKGRASGVTVDVQFEHPPPPGKRRSPPLSPSAVRYEAKVKKRVGSCVDRAVRDAVWPPSRRRDSFTIEF